MPPTYEDEVQRVEIRRLHPRTGVLVPSQHVDGFALELVSSGGAFDTCSRIACSTSASSEAAERVAGGWPLDPEVVKS